MVLLGKRIKEQRKKMNLTQEELGHLINVTKVSICCYENGTRTPTLETLKANVPSGKLKLLYLATSGLDASTAELMIVFVVN